MSEPIQITQEAIIITVRTLAALDDLQGREFIEKYEKDVQKAEPSSESKTLDVCNNALAKFVLLAPMGSAQGVRMNTSAFINGLNVMDLRNEFTIALEASKQIPHPYDT